ncbi:MAG: bifunctional [glutamate--ammonia ligase]-adenylyl-L-tyrosine phosphorylase/[glutamate--ammonia-ligase] adenylyltransferase, partial [Gammaproteobacteria bacterium]|nr:bifunctional [glutamate--ammonia ligase]-adenylyl-L-tyrosine phosphorylase/[glutamate--ammonia-ligase] adenylyltransferase [Gammaproteobacteria bacterium]
MSTAHKKPDELLRSELARVRERLAVVDGWEAIAAADPRVGEQLDRVLMCSDYVADVLARYPDEFSSLIDSGRLHRELTGDEYDALLQATASPEEVASESETQFMSRLRRYRHRELVRIVYRDLAGWSDTREMLRDLSALADTCIREAFERSSAEMQSRHGVPRTSTGDESQFVIVAMGKLGGGELNFSSDIDLVFVYSHTGETDGDRSLSNEEYFRRLAQHFINLLSKKTADGFVYRVDARLRPFGDSGPLACSAGALEDYLLQHGRDWERYAWIKGRTVNSWEGSRDYYHNVVRPFIYRRYLDFGVFASLREMKAMIEREGRAAENRENIKLGPGGIREVEFIVQTLQLVRGGAVPVLRGQSLLPVLASLGDVGLMPAETVSELTTAYLFLRDLENRLQAIADRQTHELPNSEFNRARLTLAMNFPSWEALYAQLEHWRNVVKADFEQILQHERNSAAADAQDSDTAAADTDDGLLRSVAGNCFADPDAAVERVEALLGSGLYQRMDEIGQQRLQRLLPALLQACGATGGRAQRALESVLRIVEAIGRRSAYIALLNENQAALERLVQLCAGSDMLARHIAAHPLLLDEMLDPRIFT